MTAEGITHLRGLPWGSDDVILIEGSVICDAVASHWQRIRGLDDVDAVRITPDLALTRERRSLAGIRVDDRGLPVLEKSRQWPLEEG